MVLLREILSIVLLVVPAGFQTGHLPGWDMHAISPPADHIAAPALGFDRRETLNADGYALNLFVPPEYTRLAQRPGTRARAVAWSPIADGKASQNRDVWPLVKIALRLVTAYVSGAARAAYRGPAKIVTIGIRG